MLEAGRSEQGALGLLRFFAQLEVERAVHASRFVADVPRSSIPASATRVGGGEHGARRASAD